MEWPTPGLCPGFVGRKASMYSSRFLVSREAMIVGFVVSFEDLVGKWSLLCFKFLPSVKISSWDKTKSTKNKQVREKCAIP